jgi:hypothetical protein
MSLQPEKRQQGETAELALESTLVGAAGPYGYTITLWSSGALLVRAHGLPRLPEVLALRAGAVSAFLLMAVVVQHLRPDRAHRLHPHDRAIAGALNWFAIGCAVGSVALLATIRSWVAWPASSFAATLLYMSIASAQLWAVTAVRRGELSRKDDST